MKSKKPIIFSVGHSNHPIDIFISRLKKHKISILVDVRTTPLSRFCPHFNKNALQQALNRENILYLWKGRNLGGRNINIDYDKTIIEVSEMAKGKRTCILCSEKDYKKCHRYLTLTPSLEKQGFFVKHI
ncbi:MAG: DUF488 domain-containing protein [Candidatus Staskawiczbacteria bacterium]|nr:DUF488 domain-containing protein [Candidatus Staskawiczbacteria bacterium]